MLTEIFNENAKHQKEVEFHYSARGEIDKIGRIATVNFQEDKSDHSIQEKNKKHHWHLMELLHLQEILAAMEQQLAYIDMIIVEIEENNRLIREGFNLLEIDNIAGMRDLLARQKIETHLMDDDEIREATQNLLIDKIEQQQDLQDALKLELDKFEQSVEGLDHNSQEYHNYKAELDLRRNSLEKIAIAQNLNYERAEKELRIYGDNYSALKGENNYLINHQDEIEKIADNELAMQLQEDLENDPSQRATKPLFPSNDLN